MTNRKSFLPHRKHCYRQGYVFFSYMYNYNSPLSNLKEGCCSHFLTAFSERMYKGGGKAEWLKPWENANSCGWLCGKCILSLTSLLSQRKTGEWWTQDPGPRSAHRPSLLCIAWARGTKNTVLEDLCKESPTMQQHRAGTMCVVQHTTPSSTRRILECTEPEVNQQPRSQSFLFGLHTELPGNLVISTPLIEAACFFSYEAICFLYGMASFL